MPNNLRANQNWRYSNFIYFSLALIFALVIEWLLRDRADSLMLSSQRAHLPLSASYMPNATACKPFISRANAPQGLVMDLTNQGPQPYSCAINMNSKTCETDRKAMMTFFHDEKPIISAKFMPSRTRAKNTYNAIIDNLRKELDATYSHLSHDQRQQREMLIMRFSLRIKEFVIASEALRIMLGNCAEFTAIQIAWRLIQENAQLLAPIERVSVRLGPDTHIFMQSAGEICDAYNYQQGKPEQLSKKFVMYNEHLKHPAIRQVVTIPVEIKLPLGFPPQLFNILAKADLQAQQLFVDTWMTEFKKT